MLTAEMTIGMVATMDIVTTEMIVAGKGIGSITTAGIMIETTAAAIDGSAAKAQPGYAVDATVLRFGL